MAQERLTLRKIREILRLKDAGLSNRAIARATKISNSTVGEYLRRAQVAGISWPVPENLGEDELFRQLFPPSETDSREERPLPKWETIRDELKNKGVTLKLLWIEYRDRHPNSYGYTQFCDHYCVIWAKTATAPNPEHVVHLIWWMSASESGACRPHFDCHNNQKSLLSTEGPLLGA